MNSRIFSILIALGIVLPVSAEHEQLVINLTDTVTFKMQHISAGKFLMGSASNEKERGMNESPQHEVTVNSFYIGTYEVTFKEMDACVDEGGCSHRSTDYDWGRDSQPIVDVSWDDTQEFIAWINQKTDENYRLPSEAEWEYAARAGTTTTFWWGNTAEQQGHANCVNCGSSWDDKQPAPIGSFPPNNFGLYDTAGNVWEWVQDCWHENYIDAPNNARAWLEENNGNCSIRMIRGGSWDYFTDRLRSAERFSFDADFRYYNFVGFRLAKDAN